jgi:hypothetical protein
MSTDIPEGFAPFKLTFGFLEANGPLYGKWQDEHLLLGFRVELRHCNPGRVAHGGMLATFADMLLPIAARFQSKTDMGFLPTVNLSCDARLLGGRPRGGHQDNPQPAVRPGSRHGGRRARLARQRYLQDHLTRLHQER